MRKTHSIIYVRTAVATLMASSAIGMSVPAFAQAAAEDDNDEIVVTAQKREQNLQDVPVAITAIGTEKLDQL